MEKPKDLKPHRLILQVPFTKQRFRDYGEYLNRINPYRQRIWTCEVTGKTNLTYEEPLISEKGATEKALQFPKELVVPVLHDIQFSCLENSMWKVMNADDLFIEILLRLPLKDLFDLKSVSKRWHNTISSTSFLQLYLSQRKTEDNSLSSLLGFFFPLKAEDAFIPTCALADKYSLLSTNGDLFIGSSSGLLLYYNQRHMFYRVCNPITKEWRDLPPTHNRHFNVAIGFDVEGCYEHKCKLEEFKFKVVCVLLPNSACPSSTFHMETFSSKNIFWMQHTLQASMGCMLLLKSFEYAVVINGIYYWIECMNRVLAYDSNSPRYLEENIGQVIQLPIRNNTIIERSCILGESKDGLLQYGRCDSFKIEVWVLEGGVDTPNGFDEQRWVLRHTVSYMLMCHHYPNIMSSCDLIMTKEDLRNERNAKVRDLLAFHPMNPSIVFLRLDNMIVSYCLDWHRLKLVQLRGYNKYALGGQSNRLCPYFSPNWASYFL